MAAVAEQSLRPCQSRLWRGKRGLRVGCGAAGPRRGQLRAPPGGLTPSQHPGDPDPLWLKGHRGRRASTRPSAWPSVPHAQRHPQQKPGGHPGVEAAGNPQQVTYRTPEVYVTCLYCGPGGPQPQPAAHAHHCTCAGRVTGKDSGGFACRSTPHPQCSSSSKTHCWGARSPLRPHPRAARCPPAGPPRLPEAQ